MRWMLACCAGASWMATAWVILHDGWMRPNPYVDFYARHLSGRTDAALEVMLAVRILAMASGAAVGTVATASLATVNAGWIPSTLLAAWAVLLTAVRLPGPVAAILALLALGTSFLVGRVARDAWALPRSTAMALAWISGYIFLVYNPPLASVPYGPIRLGQIPISTFVLVAWFVKARTMLMGLGKLLALPALVAGGTWLVASMGERMSVPPGRRSSNVPLAYGGAMAVMVAVAALAERHGWITTAESLTLEAHAAIVALVGGTVGWLVGELCVPPATSHPIYTWWEVSFALLLLLSSFVLPLLRLGVSENALTAGGNRWLLGLGPTAIGGAALRIAFGLSYVQVIGAMAAAGLGVESLLANSSPAAATYLTTHAAAGTTLGQAATAALVASGLLYTLALAAVLWGGGWRGVRSDA